MDEKRCCGLTTKGSQTSGQHKLSWRLRSDEAHVGDDIDEERNLDDLEVEARVRDRFDGLAGE